MPVGNRRMINPQITESGMFLMMPPSSQALYFHLCTHSDDDGVVEAYTVMKMTGSKEDDMAILIAKKFVTVLDKDLQLIWINHWQDHNLLRADRLIPSQHRELLVRILPGVSVVTPRQRTDRKRVGRPTDASGTAQDRVGIYINTDKKPKKLAAVIPDNPNLLTITKRFTELLGRIDGSRLNHEKYALRLLEENTLEVIMKRLEDIAKHREDQYFPSVHSFEDVFKKHGKISDALVRSLQGDRRFQVSEEDSIDSIPWGTVYEGPGRTAKKL